jgi:SAM-dependent methyltransferase
MNDVRAWYDERAAQFQNAIAIESGFLGLSADQQRRLNDLKLWVLTRGHEVSLRGAAVLEFGAGHGRLAVEIPIYASYTGVDLSPRLVELGNDRLARSGLADRARLVAGDCLAFEGPPESFDVVCSLGVFSYARDPEQLLRKMVWHLKPGGQVFFDVRSSSLLYDPIRRLRWKLGMGTRDANQLYSKRQLRSLFTSVGLADLRVVMRDYPVLGELFSRKSWDWPLTLRNWLATHQELDWMGTACFVFGRKPLLMKAAA